jgi:dihydrofolate synthase/folylpolyglutamate synthase
MVVGFVNDKDLDKMLDLLPRDARYYFVRPDIPRGLDTSVLKELAAAHGLHGTVAGSVKEGLILARENAGKEDLIYVGGSCFVVAEIV